jgi:hypothetical protein
LNTDSGQNGCEVLLSLLGDLGLAETEDTKLRQALEQLQAGVGDLGMPKIQPREAAPPRAVVY